ncbi:ribonuclease CL2 [Coturnix japonica]|uniref:Ribonuclease CL2 n=1 Tax=Coturnix japonica TaxID=93934 RepID=A0A8C2TJK6_COTJA|nr:ribonuclease CL2 [Coturnix japonica]
MASWMLCVALVLAAVAGAVGESRYEKFLRQHVDNPRTPGLTGNRYCGIMMARRQVTAPGRPCKPSNTFVHAPAEDLVATCTRPADTMGIHSTSTAMDITACRLRGGDTRPPCNYRARQLHHHVRVSCLDGLPVHLAGTHAAVTES